MRGLRRRRRGGEVKKEDFKTYKISLAADFVKYSTCAVDRNCVLNSTPETGVIYVNYYLFIWEMGDVYIHCKKKNFDQLTNHAGKHYVENLQTIGHDQ